MKPVTPPDPRNEQLDDLIAAALHGELTPEERTQFDARLRNEPATQAAYQKAQAMHDLLEKTHKSVQPDASFEQRMVSGVRRKIQHDQHSESAWESLLVLWTSVKRFMPQRRMARYGVILAAISVVSISVVLAMRSGPTSVFSNISTQLGYASDAKDTAKRPFGLSMGANPAYSVDAFNTASVAAALKKVDNADLAFKNNDLRKVIEEQGINYVETARKGITLSGYVDTSYTEQFAGSGEYAHRPANSVVLGNGTIRLSGQNSYTGGTTVNEGGVSITSGATVSTYGGKFIGGSLANTNGDVGKDSPKVALTIPNAPMLASSGSKLIPDTVNSNASSAEAASTPPPPAPTAAPSATPQGGSNIGGAVLADNGATSFDQNWVESNHGTKELEEAKKRQLGTNLNQVRDSIKQKASSDKPGQLVARLDVPANVLGRAGLAADGKVAPAEKTEAPAIDTRKLIRNAQLDLEVKSYQAAIDQITALTRADGGYVDTSNSQKGGNGKLQGTIVVKVLPQNLDSFLIKLRDLGVLRNQSVSTDDVTKDYYDTIARLDNSRRMEAQLQDLLKRTNGKVAELLQVERELGRVRGEIEQMQGQLKLYDFQVQYATVTMNMRETDLNQAAAYLLKENDNFSLFATDVEGTFQLTRKVADDFKAHILNANLNHNSGSDVSATLVVSVPPDQIEPFLSQLRTMGRVDNFTRQTERVAKDGGDTDQPADQTLTDKDKVIVNITIRSDDESRKQVALTVVTSTVDDALEQAKTAALGISGEILNSSLNKSPQGQSTGQLSIRVPGKSYHALLDTYRTLGRTASFSLQRDDNSGPGVNGDDVPVIVTLSLTDEETPLQQTAMSVLTTDVDSEAQQLKRDAASYGVQIKSSSFEREPNGMEMALMTFRLPMSKYTSFVENLKKLGKVEALTVARVDRPDQTRTDDTAPVEISFRLHNQGDIVASNDGFMATLRQTFGQGAGALFSSIRVIGVLVAFSVPWLFAIVLLAWIGRRIYIWKKK